MNVRRAVWAGAAGVVIAAGAAALWWPREQLADIATGPLMSAIPAQASGDLNQLPSTASQGGAILEGTKATGLVERVWVRVAEGVLVEPAAAPGSSGWRYVSVEFPDPLSNGTTVARALVPTDMVSDVAIGDVVEMRFANKNARGGLAVEAFKLLPERDQLTKMVAKSSTELARDYQRRVQARNAGPGTERADLALWKSLPLDQAFKVTHGSGRRQLAVFTDPYCPACKEFEKTLQGIDDVTVHVFLLPVIRPEKADVSRSVWCSPDRAQAWSDLMLAGKEPAAAPACADPIRKNYALLQTVGIRATPTLVFENGQRAQGSLLASAVRDGLDRASAPVQH